MYTREKALGTACKGNAQGPPKLHRSAAESLVDALVTSTLKLSSSVNHVKHCPIKNAFAGSLHTAVMTTQESR